MGLSVVLGLVAEVHRAVPAPDATLELGHREVDVPEGQRGHGEQAGGVGAAPVGEEVVVRAHARVDEVAVAEAEEVAVAETAHVRVQHLRVDALLVEERQPRGGVRTSTDGCRRRSEGVETGMMPSHPAIE